MITFLAWLELGADKLAFSQKCEHHGINQLKVVQVLNTVIKGAWVDH